jgi:hypothetical protein
VTRFDPIRLRCERDIPTIRVTQQPYPDKYTAECWITVVYIGDYPNQILLDLNSDTPADGIDAVALIAHGILDELAKLPAAQPDEVTS